MQIKIFFIAVLLISVSSFACAVTIPLEYEINHKVIDIPKKNVDSIYRSTKNWVATTWKTTEYQIDDQNQQIVFQERIGISENGYLRFLFSVEIKAEKVRLSVKDVNLVIPALDDATTELQVLGEDAAKEIFTSLIPKYINELKSYDSNW